MARELTESAVRTATVGALRTHGIAGFSREEIALSLRCPESLLRDEYGERSDLLDSVVRAAASNYRSAVGPPFAGDTPSAIVRDHARRQRAWVHKHPEEYLLFSAARTSGYTAPEDVGGDVTAAAFDLAGAAAALGAEPEGFMLAYLRVMMTVQGVVLHEVSAATEEASDADYDAVLEMALAAFLPEHNG